MTHIRGVMLPVRHGAADRASLLLSPVRRRLNHTEITPISRRPHGCWYGRGFNSRQLHHTSQKGAHWFFSGRFFYAKQSPLFWGVCCSQGTVGLSAFVTKKPVKAV